MSDQQSPDPSTWGNNPNGKADLKNQLARLQPHHLKMLRDESGITEEVIAARGYWTATDRSELEKLGFKPYQQRVPCLVIPVWTTDGLNGSHNIRPDNPRSDDIKSKGKLADGTWPQRVHKYEQLAGGGIRLDINPLCLDQLADPSIPLVITEGQKKGDALVSRGACAIALSGVWGHLGKNAHGAVTFLADWNYVGWNDREVYIVFDSDVMEKPQVQKALANLTEHIKRRSGTVRHIYLTAVNGKKVGVDDWFVLNPDLTLDDLLNLAEKPRGNGSNSPQPAAYVAQLGKLGYFMRLNELDDTVEINGHRMTDVLESRIILGMIEAGYPSRPIIKDAINVAADNNKYHPIRDYLNKLKWDGENHIEKLCSYLNFAPETADMGPVFIRKWLIGAVGKALDNAQNFMLVFKGGQDIGKDTLARWLCPLPTYFIEGPIRPDDKDSYIRLVNSFIWVVSELAATTRKADREALKAFVTMETVTVRRPHAKYDLKKPALASLIGTENGPFLNDPTGTRRFAVIELQGKPEEAIKWSYTDELDVNQIWAEAMAAYKDGESNRLTDDEKKRQAQINAGHTAISATVEVFFKVYDIDPNDDDWYTAADIIHDLEFAGLKVTQQMAYRELNELLSNEPGVTKGRPDVNGRRVTAYKGLVRI